MQTKLDDVWAARDYPMLLAIMRAVEERGLPVQDFDVEVDLDAEDRTRAYRALEARRLVTLTVRGPFPDGVSAVDGRAYTLTGLHPEGEEFGDRLISVLKQLAERTDDEEESSALRRAAAQVGHFSRDTLSAIAAAVATGGLLG